MTRLQISDNGLSVQFIRKRPLSFSITGIEGVARGRKDIDDFNRSLDVLAKLLDPNKDGKAQTGSENGKHEVPAACCME